MNSNENNDHAIDDSNELDFHHKSKVIPIFDGKNNFYISQSFNKNEHGLICWDATLVAIKYLELLVKHVPDIFNNKYILELGAGTGTVSIALCKFLRHSSTPFKKIVTTDKPICLPIMNTNANINNIEYKGMFYQNSSSNISHIDKVEKLNVNIKFQTNNEYIEDFEDSKQNQQNNEDDENRNKNLVEDTNLNKFNQFEAKSLLWEKVDYFFNDEKYFIENGNKSPVDILIVCDCIYENVSIWRNLLQCVLKLMNIDTKLLIIQERRGKIDEFFFEMANYIFEVVYIPREQQDDEYSSDDIEIYWMCLKEESFNQLQQISEEEYIEKIFKELELEKKIALTKSIEIQNKI